MNALDRKAAQIVARYLHEQDPRVAWDVIANATDPAPSLSVPEDRDASDRHATPDAPAGRHAA